MNEEKFHIVKSKTDSYGPAGSVVGKASTSNRAWSSAQRHSDKNGGTSYHVKRVEEEAMSEEHRITETNPGGMKTRYSVRRHGKSGWPIGQATIFSTRRAAEDHIARLNKPTNEEAEQIDELSKKKLTAYRGKAYDDRMDAQDDRQFYKAHDDEKEVTKQNKRIDKRGAGIDMANDKINGGAKVRSIGEGLWDNIHAKRKRIDSGSGERMRKPGSKGAPTAAALKAAQESFEYTFNLLEETANSIDKGEYDYEGQMARTQLQTILRNSKDLINTITNNDNMPEWVQSKITLAQDYITCVRDYLQSKKELGESSNSTKSWAIATPTKKGGWKRVPDTKFSSEDSAHDYGTKYHTSKIFGAQYKVIPHPNNMKEEMVANNMSGGAIADPKNKMLLKSPVKRFKEFVKS
jgi:hypothetical protein